MLGSKPITREQFSKIVPHLPNRYASKSVLTTGPVIMGLFTS